MSGLLIAPLDPTLGRDDDLARVRARLGEVRLCSITGPVGVGKSRLARIVADALRDSLDGEVSWCDLEGIESIEQLNEHLHRLDLPLAPCLLVVDGADGHEAVLRAVLPSWLSQHPERRALVTSRERIAIAGEGTLSIAPLSLADGIALFERRAREADDRFALDAPGREAVARIVQLVDGLPLAIELCAAQTLVLDPVALLAHLQSGSSRLDVAAHGDSLRRAVAAAWRLLPAPLEPIAAACATFERGFTLPGARAVAEASMPDVRALCERSLLRVEDGPRGRRFRLYGPLQDYARAQGLPDEAWQRHRRYFLQRLQQGRVDAETRVNLLAAAARAHRAGAHADALQTWVAITPLVLRHGPVRAVLRGLEQVWSATPTSEHRLARGSLYRLDGQLDAAIAELQRGLADAADEDPVGAALACELGSALRHAGRAEEATSHYEQALEHPHGSPALRAQTREQLGGHLFERGAIDQARAHLERARAAYAESGDEVGLARVEHTVGVLEQEAGNHEAASACFETAHERHQAVGNERFAAIARFDLGALLLETHAVGRAQTVLQEALERLQAVGDRRQVALTWALLGVCAALREQPETAQTRLRAALEISAHSDDPGLESALAIHRLQLSDRPPPAQVGTSDEERFALRLLRGAREHAASSLRVSPDHATVRGPDGVSRPVRSDAARRMLAGLLDAHEAPDHPSLSASALHRLGWPGARALDDSARNRLHVELSKLRKAGLAGHLVRDASGYRIEGPIRRGPISVAAQDQRHSNSK